MTGNFRDQVITPTIQAFYYTFEKDHLSTLGQNQQKCLSLLEQLTAIQSKIQINIQQVGTDNFSNYVDTSFLQNEISNDIDVATLKKSFLYLNFSNFTCPGLLDYEYYPIRCYVVF